MFDQAMTSAFMQPSPDQSRGARRSRVGRLLQEGGFHRADLLVCISLIFLFGALGVAAFSQGETDSRLAKCRNNLRQLHQAATAYGDNHNGQTPPVWPGFTSGGFWPWDMSTNTTDTLVALGARPEYFYCPSAPTYYDIEMYWNYSSSFRVLGYVFATAGAPRVLSSELATSFTMPNPESRPYIVDATLSLGANNSNREANLYTGVVGAYPSSPHGSAHMRGKLPEGGNLMMLDGHIEWRGFENMRVRTTGSPAFWW